LLPLKSGFYMGTLTVTGVGVENVPTTIVQVRLGVEVQGRTASRVQQLTAQRSAAVVAFLQSQTVDQLETTGISLQPTMASESDRPQTNGFTGTNLVSFRTTFEAVGALLDKAVDVGATRIDRVEWRATDEAIQQARQSALQQATQDALTQARAVLDGLKFSQGEILSIEVGGAGGGEFHLHAGLSAPLGSVTPVLQGEQPVEARVTLQIRY
jgi:uncharacterized protein